MNESVVGETLYNYGVRSTDHGLGVKGEESVTPLDASTAPRGEQTRTIRSKASSYSHIPHIRGPPNVIAPVKRARGRKSKENPSKSEPKYGERCAVN